MWDARLREGFGAASPAIYLSRLAGREARSSGRDLHLACRARAQRRMVSDRRVSLAIGSTIRTEQSRKPDGQSTRGTRWETQNSG